MKRNLSIFTAILVLMFFAVLASPFIGKSDFNKNAFNLNIIEKVLAETHTYVGPSDITVTSSCNASTPSVKLDINWHGSVQKAGANGFALCKNSSDVDIDHDSCVGGVTIPTSATFANQGPQTINDTDVQAGQTYTYEWLNVDHHSEEFPYWTNCQKIVVAACGGSSPASTTSVSCTGPSPVPSGSLSGTMQCADGLDNDGDGKIDSADPGCHTDGNPNNSGSYDPTDNDESDPQCSDAKDNDGDGKIDSADPGCHSDGNANNTATYNPGDTDETDQTPPSGTVCYKLAESEAGLASAPCVPYNNHPTITNWDHSDGNPGPKQVWVEYVADNGATQIDHITIDLIAPDPHVEGLDCTLDIGKENLKITLNGENFGDGPGSLIANNANVDILGWNANQVSGLLKKPTISLEEGQKYIVILSRNDGVQSDPVSCQVNRSLLSLGAKVFCRRPGEFDVTGVKVTLVDTLGTRVDETVAIDKDGFIQGLKTRLQSGKRYVVSIKAPYSLRRNSEFTAQEGTTVITAENFDPFILPIGDIAPVIQQDGVINSFDKGELTRQWRVLGTSTKATSGDFNRDTKVNSVDWACMRYDFDERDDEIPTKVSDGTTPPPSGGPVIVPSSSPQNSNLATFSLTSQQTASAGAQIPVKVLVSTDQDAANLFIAKLSFPTDKLEVVSLDKSNSFVGSWTEEFYDNTTGVISLVGGIPTPGFKTSGSPAEMVTIIFKAKQAGAANISFNSQSQIYRNSDNENILNFSSTGTSININ